MPLTKNVIELCKLTNDPKYLPPRLKTYYDFIKEKGRATSYDLRTEFDLDSRKAPQYLSDLFKTGLIEREYSKIEDRENVSGYQYVYSIKE